MKRMIVFSIGIVLCATPLFAQGGVITLFADPGGIDCAVYDTQPNTLIHVYVFHVLAPEALAAQFSVPVPSCAVGMMWLGDTQVFWTHVGLSPTGIAIAYDGTCFTGPVHILTINYWGMGTSDECCRLTVEPDPRETPPGIYMTNCNSDLFTAMGGSAIINPNPTCPCFNVPVEHSTWGKVKALYAE